MTISITKYLRYFIIILLHCIVSPLFGQDPAMLHYSIDDGLPSNTIYNIYRDHKGFLWFATDKGVARYNGLKFEVFTSFDGLADNEVFFFQEDTYDRLWMGTYNGELCYYKNDTFFTMANLPFLKLKNRHSHISYITIEDDSSVLIGYDNRLQALNIFKDHYNLLDLGKVKTIPLMKYFSFMRKIIDNRFLLVCRNGTILIDSNYNILKVDYLRIDSIDRISSCQGQNYVYNSLGIYNLNFEKIKNFPANFNIDNLHQIYMDHENIFYTTSKGLYINDQAHTIKEENVSSVTQDVEGNYWVSTLNNGVFVFNKDIFKTKKYVNCYTGFAKNAYINTHGLYFSTTANDLYVLRAGKVKKLLAHVTPEVKDLSYEKSSYSLFKNNAYYNFYSNKAMVVSDLSNPKYHIEHYGIDPSLIKKVILTDSALYRRSRVSIHIIRGIGKQKKLHDISVLSPNNEHVFDMSASFDNTIWYSTIDHLYKLEHDTGKYQSQFKNTSFKTFDFIGKYLIGATHNNQLLICSDINDHPKIDSLFSPGCIWDKFYPLDSTHILISTNNFYRLLTIVPGNNTKQFSITTIEDPFIPTGAECICVDTGYCYFFKNNSITAIQIKSIFTRSHTPQLFFRHLKTNKKTYTITNELFLDFKEAKNITISFSTLLFSSKEVSYQYSVSRNGIDNWQDIVGEINLAHPGYGNYFIKVRAKTISSEYSPPILFQLHILPPFWVKWWFIVWVAAVLISGISILFRYRVIKAIKKKEKAHKDEIKFMKSEYKALNALMNPHFIFNTLNNVQDLINSKDVRVANEYLRIFADLVRQNMHNISKEQITLQKEMDLVKNYLSLEKLRFHEILNYSIETDEGLDLTEIMIPPLLIQPLVENSIKHGILPLQSDKGTICIKIYEQSANIYIEVRDNGIGMTAINKSNSQHKSYGLDNIRTRIEQLSAMQNIQITLSIERTTDKAGQEWTVVKISFPYLD